MLFFIYYKLFNLFQLVLFWSNVMLIHQQYITTSMCFICKFLKSKAMNVITLIILTCITFTNQMHTII